ncbi:MAG: Csu type fimbrial protein [Vulcanimicrobiaceae bacterium]
MTNASRVPRRLRSQIAVAVLVPLLLAGSTISYAAPLHARLAAARINGAVATDCSLSTLPISFTIGIGYIHAPGNKVLAQSSLAVRCSKGASVLIGMNAGLYGSAAGSRFGTRSMKSTDGSYLGYDLCHDSACASVWTPAGFSYTSPSDQGSSLPVWARIVTGQPQAKQGAYSDSVTVTVSF